jgi:prophage tail gpP-like protein
LLTSRQASLEEVIAQVVRPLGIKNIELHAESSIRNDKITTEPGERAWDILLPVPAAGSGRGSGLMARWLSVAQTIRLRRWPRW